MHFTHYPVISQPDATQLGSLVHGEIPPLGSLTAPLSSVSKGNWRIYTDLAPVLFSILMHTIFKMISIA